MQAQVDLVGVVIISTGLLWRTESSLMPKHVAEALRWELFYRLASRLPPFALESLHHAAHARCCSSAAATTTVGIGGPDGNKRGVKRSRCEDFNSAWQALFKLRCPLDDNARHDSLVTVDWQQQYWEKHLQECLDEAALLQRLHCFLLFVGVLVSYVYQAAKIMSSVYHIEDISHKYSRLSYHCSRLGCYARCLRLQNVLCTADICGMLQHSTLENLIFIRIISDPEVAAVAVT